jgi:hypothetical protein
MLHIPIGAENSENALSRESRIVSPETFQFPPKTRPAQYVQQILHARQIQMLLSDHQVVPFAYQRNEMQPKHASRRPRSQAAIHRARLHLPRRR